MHDIYPKHGRGWKYFLLKCIQFKHMPRESFNQLKSVFKKFSSFVQYQGFSQLVEMCARDKWFPESTIALWEV